MDGNKIIEIAKAYANYGWTASEKNRCHSVDIHGIMVDTPDISWRGETLNCGWWLVNELNIGIPYAWGCASTIREFEEGILKCKYAGNVPEDKKRSISLECVGVDCSGLLSICWELPKKIATRDIPKFARELYSLEEMQAGDIFAKIGSHVMIFCSFTDRTRQYATIIDATRTTGKVSERMVVVSELLEHGYQIFRRETLEF